MSKKKGEGDCMSKKREVTHRIPFDIWINSQLSVARFYGGCKLNGKFYEFDPEMMKISDKELKVKPDLITYDT